MVQLSSAAEGSSATFVIQPNHSMSWRALLAAYAVIATTTLTIGIYFYLLGLSLVLPFSGLELVVLGAALYTTARRAGRQEVIAISPEGIAVEAGLAQVEFRQAFQRPWTRVVLERSPNSWYPSRLLIRSRGQQVEVGSFLNEQERRGLAEQLFAAMRRSEFQPMV